MLAAPQEAIHVDRGAGVHVASDQPNLLGYLTKEAEKLLDRDVADMRIWFNNKRSGLVGVPKIATRLTLEPLSSEERDLAEKHYFTLFLPKKDPLLVKALFPELRKRRPQS